MLDILGIIVIIIIFVFIVLSQRENDREYKRTMDELKEKGKLPSKKIFLLRFLAVMGGMVPIPLILAIIVIYMKKFEFSIEEILGWTFIFYIVEMIIVSIIGYIIIFFKDCKKQGFRKTIISFLFAAIATGIVLYIRYNW